ncbi:MAG: TonB-dependent siderophore receptor [Leifsonia xyli]|nr:MAG: TonB-dependent siderophore receptor [Leifsonia xyli]
MTKSISRRGRALRLMASTALLLSPCAAFAQSAEEPTTLDPITVEGRADGVRNTTAGPVQGIRALTASSSTRTDTPIEKTPQTIQVIPRQLLEQQSTTTISEATRNVSNVQPANPAGIANTDFAPLRIRGFPAEQWRDGIVVPYDAGDRDGLVNVERIEIPKGPGAIVFGGGFGAPLGGVLNVISKLPEDAAFAETGIRVGNHGYWNPWLDVNAPLTKEGTALFRFTGEFSKGGSDLDRVDPKRYSLNPTVTLTNKEDTTLTIQGFVNRHEQKAYQGLPFGVIGGGFNVSRHAFIGPDNTPDSYSRNAGVTVTLDHAFNDVWSLNLKGRYSESQFDQLSQILYGGDAYGAIPADGVSTWNTQNLRLFQKQKAFTINPTVKAEFDIGQTENVVLFGADYSRTKDAGYMLGGADFGTVNLDDMSYSMPFEKPDPSTGMFFFNYRNTYATAGAYTQIQSTVFDRVHLLGGLRLANIDIDYKEAALPGAPTFKTEKTKLLPRAGVLVDLTPWLSAYASYSQGMRWAGFYSAIANPVPELSEQAEAGLKFNFDDTLTGTLAVFDIRRDNVPVQTGIGQAGLSKQRSRGFDADVIWQPTREWSFLANYGYADATYDQRFQGGNGVVPKGNQLLGVPKHSGRLWANYAFSDDRLKGFSVGGGVYMASGQFVDAENQYRTKGYHTLDGKIGYERDNWRAALSVKNITDKKYYTPFAWLGGQVAPGASRTFVAEVSYLFK